MLAYRELDDALRLTDTAITRLLDCRRGKNTRHKLGGLLRQSVFGRLAGYEDVNDAERLARDPVIRYAIRLPANQALQRRIGDLRTWLVGRSPKKPIVSLQRSKLTL